MRLKTLHSICSLPTHICTPGSQMPLVPMFSHYELSLSGGFSSFLPACMLFRLFMVTMPFIALPCAAFIAIGELGGVPQDLEVRC